MMRLKIRIPDIAQIDVSIGAPVGADAEVVALWDEQRQIMIFARPDEQPDFPAIEVESDWLPLTEGQDFTREVTPR